MFSLLDRYFAEFLADVSGLAGPVKERFYHLAARVSAALEDGHSCLPLTDEEIDFLAGNPLISDGGRTPLVLHNRRLYLHRYFQYESRLAEKIRDMAGISIESSNDNAMLGRYFDHPGPGPDWQREAAKVALARSLTIICGGPGTGKTTTVAKILALLHESGGQRDLTMALAAPTGKAAMRLSEAMSTSIARLNLPEGIQKALPTSACTLHRLLGVRRGSPQFRHNHDNPLGWDVVVVDEASMVDLAMMSKLVDAIKPGARLILLGDKDQLASVESGAVLGDCIRGLPENTVELRETYRFDTDIQQLASTINGADATAAWGLLTSASPVSRILPAEDLIGYISAAYARFMALVNSRLESMEIHQIFKQFHSFRVLCALHYGNHGVDAINRQVELALLRRGFPCRPEAWYPGRPVLITVNDYGLDLYNGDIGICLPSPENGELQVWFQGSDGGLRRYPPSRLADCKTVFAMTIHKSQGSEFDEVLVVLPEEDHRILSRELIYTAVTRAKKEVRLVAGKEIFSLALSRNIERASGLADWLGK